MSVARIGLAIIVAVVAAQSLQTAQAQGSGTLSAQSPALTGEQALALKNPAPFSMAKEYPITTGLADFFGVLREHPNQATKVTKLRKA